MENLNKLRLYSHLPGKQQLEEDFEEFIDSNPQFQGKIKVGKTFFDKVVGPSAQQRYSSVDKYEQLTVDHIFARCATEALALQVEEECQQIAKSKGTLIYRSGDGQGGLSIDNDRIPVVYVTKLKNDLYKCPLPTCTVVKTRAGIETHKMEHNLIEKTIRLNRWLGNLGRPPLEIEISPVPWKPEDQDIESSKCKFCGKILNSRKYMLEHQRVCTKNINKRNKSTKVCPVCNKTVVRDLPRHMATHDKAAEKFTCPVCQLVVSKGSKARHMKLHDDSQYDSCGTCGKRIAKTSMKRHMTTHQPRKKIKCELCGMMISADARTRHMINKHKVSSV